MSILHISDSVDNELDLLDIGPDMMAQHRIGWIGTHNVQDGGISTCHTFFNSCKSGDLDHKHSKETTCYNSGRKVVQYNRTRIGQISMPAKTGLSDSPVNG